MVLGPRQKMRGGILVRKANAGSILGEAAASSAIDKFLAKLGLAQNRLGEIILRRFIGRLLDVIDFLVHLHLLLGIKEGHEFQQWIIGQAGVPDLHLLFGIKEGHEFQQWIIGWAGVLDHLGLDPIQEIVAVQSLTWDV